MTEKEMDRALESLADKGLIQNFPPHGASPLVSFDTLFVLAVATHRPSHKGQKLTRIEQRVLASFVWIMADSLEPKRKKLAKKALLEAWPDLEG